MTREPSTERYRPDWWPHKPRSTSTNDTRPMGLYEICDELHCHATGSGRALHPEVFVLLVQALSHACRNWRSPSTPYEHALYSLCLAAIEEANTHTAQTAGKQHDPNPTASRQV